jgi:hypothetical protein
MIHEIMEMEFGKILVSVILGFGLATMFAKICKGSDCVVIQGPPIKEIKENIYRIDDDCYKYTPLVTKCN